MDLRVLAILLTGLAGGTLARHIKMPGGSFLGAMLATSAVSILALDSQPLPDAVRSIALVLMGISVGASVDRQAVLGLLNVLPWALGVILILIAVSIAIGRALHGVVDQEVSAVTLMLGVMPGGASGMIAAAYDLGGDPSIVASLHAVRQFIVFGALPLLLRWLSRGPTNSRESKTSV